MEITFSPPLWVLIICGVVAVIGIPVTLLKRGKVWQKMVSLAIIAVLTAGLLLFFYREHHFSVNETGIETDVYGTVRIPWQDLKEMEIVISLPDSSYKPVVKLNGVGLGSLQYGWYKLKNGETAFIYVEQINKGVLLRTKDKTYLFALDRIDDLIAGIQAYRPG